MLDTFSAVSYTHLDVYKRQEHFPAKSGTESFRENIYGNVIFRWQIRLRNEAEKGEDTNMRKMGSDGQLKRMICNACGKKLAVKPVSYTHLDVYKRQGGDQPKFFLQI